MPLPAALSPSRTRWLPSCATHGSAPPQLQQFLGVYNFYRRFVPAVAKTLRPLTDALRGVEKKAPVLWSADMAAAFTAAKAVLTATAELAHPLQGAELAQLVDASDNHTGAVLH